MLFPTYLGLVAANVDSSINFHAFWHNFCLLLRPYQYLVSHPVFISKLVLAGGYYYLIINFKHIVANIELFVCTKRKT